LKFSSRLIALMGFLLLGLLPSVAQDAKAIVQKAVQSELSASKNDHSLWRYRDADKAAGDSVWIVVQTAQGSVKRLIEKGGQPLAGAQANAEDQRVQAFIHDADQLARQKKDGEHDDKNATELLTMLPEAFLWKVQSEDEQRYTLHFQPNPDFHPPNMQSRVLGMMIGEIVVSKKHSRIETINGKLMKDITIGWGLLGRLHEGGTFRVERREIAPGIWQITETHVHIEGKALLFKNIGQEQDEVQTDFTRVPEGTTLEQAAEMSKTLK
jgi:hypothetical protein